MNGALGRLVISHGRVTQADFKQLKLGAHNDFSLIYQMDQNGGRSIEAKGKVIDASNAIDSDEEADEKPAKLRRTPLSVKAAFDVTHLKNDVWYQNLRVAYADDGVHMTAFNMSTTADNSGIRGELADDRGRFADVASARRRRRQDAARLHRFSQHAGRRAEPLGGVRADAAAGPARGSGL